MRKTILILLAIFLVLSLTQTAFAQLDQKKTELAQSKKLPKTIR